MYIYHPAGCDSAWYPTCPWNEWFRSLEYMRIYYVQDTYEIILSTYSASSKPENSENGAINI
jgi:hypothetical protein